MTALKLFAKDQLYIAKKPAYTVTKKKESVISALETSSSLLFRWFNNNFMKANSDKSHLIMSCTEATTTMIDGLPSDSAKQKFS